MNLFPEMMIGFKLEPLGIIDPIKINTLHTAEERAIVEIIIYIFLYRLELERFAIDDNYYACRYISTVMQVIQSIVYYRILFTYFTLSQQQLKTVRSTSCRRQQPWAMGRPFFSRSVAHIDNTYC